MPAFRAPQRLANASEIAGATRGVPFSPRGTDDCPSQYHRLLVHALHPVGANSCETSRVAHRRLRSGNRPGFENHEGIEGKSALPFRQGNKRVDIDADDRVVEVGRDPP
jgi:hypothetical protein